MLVKFGKYKNRGILSRFFGLEPKRREIIKIENCDVWNMDKDLSKIIYPMLVKLKQIKHGSPFVEFEDVPEELRPSAEEIKNIKVGEVDDNFHERWNYVLDKMIYSFRRYSEDWEEEHYSNDNFDKDGYFKEHKEIMEGIRLFAKYYMSLFD